MTRPRLERAGMAALEAGSLVMERKMLDGIKRRAQSLHAAGAALPLCA